MPDASSQRAELIAPPKGFLYSRRMAAPCAAPPRRSMFPLRAAVHSSFAATAADTLVLSLWRLARTRYPSYDARMTSESVAFAAVAKRVLIADDHPLYRDALRAIVPQACPDADLREAACQDDVLRE